MYFYAAGHYVQHIINVLDAPKTRDGHTLQLKQEVSRYKKTKPFNGTAHDD